MSGVYSYAKSGSDNVWVICGPSIKEGNLTSFGDARAAELMCAELEAAYLQGAAIAVNCAKELVEALKLAKIVGADAHNARIDEVLKGWEA